MDWTRSGELIVMVVLGGMGTLFGPVAGADAFLLLEKMPAAWTEHWLIVLGPSDRAGRAVRQARHRRLAAAAAERAMAS